MRNARQKAILHSCINTFFPINPVFRSSSLFRVVTTCVLVLAVSACDPGPNSTEISQTQPSAGNDSLSVVVDSLSARLADVEGALEAARSEIDSLTASPQIVVDSAAPITVGMLASILDTLVVKVDTTREASSDSSDVAGAPGLQDVGRAVQTIWENVWLRVVETILVALLTYFAVRGIISLLTLLAERNAKRRLFYKKLVPIVRIVLWSIAAYIVIRVIFQIDPRNLFAAGTAAVVGLAFAAQDLLKNLFGGLVIIFDQPFQAGDKIRVGDAYGEVVSIGLRSTRIVTPDDNLVTIPNAQVVGAQVANANSGELNCQVVTNLYLPGWVNEAKAKKIAYEAAANSQYVYLDKPIVVLVKDVFKETFLTNIVVKAYVIDTRYEFLLMSEITERSRAEFRNQGLIVPTYGAANAPPLIRGDGG